MLLEMLDSKYKSDFFLLDQCFMVFYVAELLLRAALLQGRLLVGPLHAVWWNWLDVVVVITGVVDQWLMSLFAGQIPKTPETNNSHRTSALQLVRMLRMARLARILKIVKIVWNADVSWAEDNGFQVFIMSVIGVNSLIMSFETDFPDFFLWFYVEQTLLVIFVFELCVRLKLWGCQ